MGKREKRSPPPPSSLGRSWRDPLTWLMAATLLTVVFAAYRPAAGGAFLWDDDDYVALNPDLRSARGLADIWLHPTHSPQYYPLTFTTFWIEYQLWGDQPRGYHEINVLLHAACALLVWRLLRALEIRGAFLATMIFAIHPVMVESVAWITERKNTLSLLFALSSLLTYLRFVNANLEAPASRRRWLYALSLALFACALASKTVTATLPAAILLILWWKDRRSRRTAVGLIPFVLLGIVAGVTTAVIERHHVGAAGPEWNFSPAQRFLIASRAVCFYTAKLLWPSNLSFVYSRWHINPTDVVPWLFPTALLAPLIALFVIRRRIGRGPLVAALLFVVTLAPALGLVNVYPMRYTFAADHYQYHAAIVLIALIVSVATTLFAKLPPRRQPVAVAAAVTLLAILFTLTWQRSQVYRTPQSLWADTVHKSPDSWMAWLNLGHALRARRPPDLAAADDACTHAASLGPDIADTHLGLAQLAIDQGRYPEAIHELERVLALEPTSAVACNTMGFCLRKTTGPAAALPWFEKSISIRPRYWPGQFNVALALKDAGQIAPAAAAFERAIEIDPTAAEQFFHLADCYRRLGKPDLAEQALREVLARQPTNAEAHFSLAALLRQSGRIDEADAHRAKALTLKPALRNLLPTR